MQQQQRKKVPSKDDNEKTSDPIPPLSPPSSVSDKHLKLKPTASEFVPGSSRLGQTLPLNNQAKEFVPASLDFMPYDPNPSKVLNNTEYTFILPESTFIIGFLFTELCIKFRAE